MINPVQTKFGGSNSLGRFAQKTVANLSNSKALAPVILLEGSVLAGRCYHAKERGGWVELRERFLEETLTAAVWFFGITTLNKLGDNITKRFNLDTTIDVGKDELDNAYGKLKEHIKGPLERFTDGKSPEFRKKLTTVKFAKIVLSTITGIYIVGNIIPKFKNSVTENAKANPNQNSFAAALFGGLNKNKTAPKQTKEVITYNPPSMEKFLGSNKSNNTNFKGGLNLVSLSHKLENDNIYKMLTVDTGIVTGRSMHARNDDEKIEIVIRDIGSLYFYMASTHHVANFLSNKLGIDKKMGLSTKIDPRITQTLNEKILAQFDENLKNLKTNSMSETQFNEFMTGIFGRNNKELVETLKAKAEKTDNNLDLEIFKTMIKGHKNEENIIKNAKTAAKLNNQIITSSEIMKIARHLEELATDKEIAEKLKILPTDKKEIKKLKKLPQRILKISDIYYKKTSIGKEIASTSNDVILRMLNNLPKLNLPINKTAQDTIKELKEHLGSVKNDNNFIVTAQIEDIVHDGLVRDQSFLKEAFAISHPEVKNPKKYVPLQSFINTKENIQNYAECLKANLENAFADNKTITLKELQDNLNKFKNKNLKMKSIYLTAGLGVSAYFLSTGIPKFQQYVTKKRTGTDNFPGAR